MKNKWFNDTFLPSLFDRIGVNNRVWLSAKQTAVCTQYMELHRTVYDADGYESRCTSIWYSCEWQERAVHLYYSKSNQCGCIEFGANLAEAELRRAEHDAEQDIIRQSRVKRIRKNSERLAREIERLAKKIDDLEACAEECAEEPAQNDMEYYISAITDAKAELARLTNAEGE